MKKYLNKRWVFEFSLKLFAFFARKELFNSLTSFLTSSAAVLNVKLNRPQKSSNVHGLAQTWQKLMPIDGRHLFKIVHVEGETALTQIHLHCPLRGTGDVQACYKLMNYDRKLMETVGGELIVLESQSNSGRPFCKLAIRKKGADVSDLTPAHLKKTRL